MTNPLKVWDGTQWKFVSGVEGPQGPQGIQGVAGPAGVLASDPNYSVNDWWNTTQGGGRISGGNVTSNGDGTVAIAAGTGLVKAEAGTLEDCPCSGATAPISQNQYVTWAAVPSLLLTDNAYNYVYYKGSTGTIEATTDFYLIDPYRDFTIGRAYRRGTNVIVRLCGTNLWNFNRRVQLFGEEYLPVVRAKGMMVGSTGTRNITVTEGVVWAELVNRFTTPAFDSSALGTFSYYYRDGVGGFTEVTAQTQINNLNYDNGTGTLGTLTNNRYGVHWVYMVHDGTVHVVYGQGDYALPEAEAATAPLVIPGLLSAYGTLIAKLIVLKSSDVLSIFSSFTQNFGTSGTVSIHNDLSGIQGGTAGEYFHLTSAQVTKLTNLAAPGIVGQTGGTNGKVVRISDANTWVDASQADSIVALTGLLFRQADTYYPPGSVITGLTGLVSTGIYYLDTAGNITLTAPTPSATVRLVVIGKAISTTSLLFTPGTPIGGE